MSTRRGVRLAGLLLALCIHLALFAVFITQPQRDTALPDPSRMVLAWVLPPPPVLRPAPALPEQPQWAPPRRKPARGASAAPVQALPAPGSTAQDPAPDDLPDDPFAEAGPGTVADPKVVDAAIKKAFAERKALEDTQKFVKSAPGPNKYEQFGADMDFAKIPYCLGDNSLKHNPPVIKVAGVPVVMGGLFALPFMVHAAATGKCRVK